MTWSSLMEYSRLSSRSFFLICVLCVADLLNMFTSSVCTCCLFSHTYQQQHTLTPHSVLVSLRPGCRCNAAAVQRAVGSAVGADSVCLWSFINALLEGLIKVRLAKSYFNLRGRNRTRLRLCGVMLFFVCGSVSAAICKFQRNKKALK